MEGCITAGETVVTTSAIFTSTLRFQIHHRKTSKEKKNNLKNDNVESNSNQFPPPEFREIL
jgi:hypothetical protein